ncbi:MAG: hypothetical protein ACK5Z5_02285 [Neisseriaceae bacterium]
MEILTTASVTIDKNRNILNYNKLFANLFLNNINLQIYSELTLDQIIDYPFKIQQCKKTALLIKNNIINNQYMLGYFYIYIKKNNNSYLLQFTNWLNWVDNLYTSLNYSYNKMTELNDDVNIQIEYSSDIHAFNALFPLLMHKPLNFIKQINTHAFFGILRKFINRRDTDIISKDYVQHTYRRLETSIKEQTGMSNIEITEIMKQREILSFRHMGQIYIPNTKIKKNILITDYSDNLLNLFLNNQNAELQN